MKYYLMLLILIIFLSGCASKATNQTTEGKFPVYGNWCGPSHPAKGKSPIPIDEIDAACMRHDQCYGVGYFSCECDDRLLKELFEIKEQKWQGRKIVSGEEYKTFEKPIASAIRSYFALSGCNPKGSIKSSPRHIAIKGATAVDTATSSVGKGAILVIDKAYYIIQLPFLLLGKGLCAIHSAPSCYLIDERIRSGRGVKTIVGRK